jgi:penicillin amidase
VAYDDMPQLRDPENGLIVTANQRIVDDHYPHYLGLDYARPERALRLHERLDAVHDATVETMTAVHADRRSLGARRWVERLVELEPRDVWERAALDRLRAWDFDMQPDSAAAAVYVVARDAACRIVAHNPVLAPLRHRYPDEPAATFQPLELRLWTALPGLLAADDTVLLPAGQNWGDLLAAALSDAVGVLRTALGDDVAVWRWGDLHVFAPRHPLGRAELDPPAAPMGGEWDTVMSSSHAVGHGFRVTTSSVTRYVFDLADWERCAWIVPLGVSGDAAAAHFADQLPLWLAGELVPMGWAWNAIEREAESTTRLGPGA